MSETPRKPKKVLNKSKTKIPMREQAPNERIFNFEEVPLGYNEEEASQEALRCIQCKNKPCVAGCPVGIDIPAFLALVGEKDYEGALHKIKEKNFLPAICGRVCPQEDQCEMVCTLNKPDKGREPGGVGRVERFLGDYAMEHNLTITPKCDPPTGKTVAIIGSGPAGLTAASDLAQKGHDVTVFEALHKPGGVLFYGIPQFRLPKEILLREVQGLEKMGVKLDVAVEIDVSRDVILDRLTTRRTCKDCGEIYNVKSNPPAVEGKCDKCGEPVVQRDDETEEAISNRLNVYNDQTAPLVGFYKDEGLLLSVAATSSDAVIDAIKGKLGK